MEAAVPWWLENWVYDQKVACSILRANKSQMMRPWATHLHQEQVLTAAL